MSTRLNREAYEKLVKEDIEWLRQQPRTLERDHILVILEKAVDYEYGYCKVCRDLGLVSCGFPDHRYTKEEANGQDPKRPIR